MVNISGTPIYRGPEEIRYLFIDGAYFRKVIDTTSQTFFNGETIPIDYSKLSSDFTKTFYYDCLPPKKASESQQDYALQVKPVQDQFDHLRSLNGFHVYEGTIHGKPRRVRQKKIDVMIAIDMLTHSFRRNMHKATLLTGDLDFKPLIDALVQDGMYVTLWYERTSTSKELMYAADARRPLDVRNIHALAMDVFQKEFSMPAVSRKPRKDTRAYTHTRIGKSSYGDKIELYQEHDHFLVIYPSSGNLESYIHIEHNDLEFLEKFIRNIAFEFKWI